MKGQGHVTSHDPASATSLANSIGSTIEGLSFAGLLTRVEIGHSA
jgi:hypothetical protein